MQCKSGSVRGDNPLTLRSEVCLCANNIDQQVGIAVPFELWCWVGDGSCPNRD
jgi:hypothetical protein